jgi:hypothetical protein
MQHNGEKKKDKQRFTKQHYCVKSVSSVAILYFDFSVIESSFTYMYTCVHNLLLIHIHVHGPYDIENTVKPTNGRTGVY